MKAWECPQCGQQMFKWGRVYYCTNPKCKGIQRIEKRRGSQLTIDMILKGLVISGRKGQEGGEA